MSKKKPTIIEARTLREQLQDYIREIVEDFEAVTGMTVKWIDVKHERKPGFGEKERISINAELEL